MYTFALKAGMPSDKERQTLTAARALNPDKYSIRSFNRPDEVPEGFIPAGTIDWVQDVLGFKPIPDFYPEFLKHLLYREVWQTDEWPLNEEVFIKPADVPKRFSAKRSCDEHEEGPCWCSEIVNFKNEWRYYITYGEVVYAAWYDGIEECEAPELEIDIPSYWCGCIDMGILDTGEFALVEAGEPYSCGWYGHIHEGDIYADWLIDGYYYLLTLAR
jgi:hypothetical protein